jgi:hypothetical protein
MISYNYDNNDTSNKVIYDYNIITEGNNNDNYDDCFDNTHTILKITHSVLLKLIMIVL